MFPNRFILFGLIGFACSTFFSDLFRGFARSGRYDNLISDLGEDIENNENEAGQFICQVLQGQVPTVIEELPDEIYDEIEDDFDSLASFIESLPTIAPEVLGDIEQGGEVVVSIITELIQNPGGALTVLIGDVETVAGDVISGTECLFRSCAPPVNTAEVNLVNACQNILAAATTYVVTSTYYGTGALPSAYSTLPAVTSATAAASSIPAAAPSTLIAALSTSAAASSIPAAAQSTLFAVPNTFTTASSIFVDGTSTPAETSIPPTTVTTTLSSTTASDATTPTAGSNALNSGAKANTQKGVAGWGLLMALIGVVVY